MATENLTTEQWLPVAGYEGRYEVSDLGRVRALLHPNGSSRTNPLIMRPEMTRCGYLRVQLGGRHASVHRLVAVTFVVPTAPGLRVCNHLDGVKTNNIPANLEWTTHKGNAAHAVATGLYPAGDRHGSHKHPEAKPRGNSHWTRRNPERVLRGDTHPYAAHPERHARGERCSKAKLTPDIVREIRRRYAAGGVSQPMLGREYGVAHSAIGRIVNRLNWKHVK